MPAGRRSSPHRIKSTRELRALRRSGKPYRGEFVTVWASIPEGVGRDPGCAIGVVAGRGFRTSVLRNRVKRQVSGCIMELTNLLDPGCVDLVECRPSKSALNYQKLVNELKEIFPEAGKCSKKEERIPGRD